jgi:hypothetical protein
MLDWTVPAWLLGPLLTAIVYLAGEVAYLRQRLRDLRNLADGYKGMYENLRKAGNANT